MRVRELVYAGAIAVSCLVALTTPVWWAAIAVFAAAEAALSLLERRGARGAVVIPLPRADAILDAERHAA